MRFRDFDVGMSPGYLPHAETRSINIRSRAFVEAVVQALWTHKVEAPWGKLYVDLVTRDPRPYFMPARPKIGLSAAGARDLLLPEALRTAEGEAVRPLLGGVVTSTRELIRREAGWDDPWFWDLIEATGRHRGPYERRAIPRTDRRAHVVYRLTYEWDEAGTTVYLDARRSIDAEERLGRVLVRSFPEVWELAWHEGFSPKRLVLEPDAVVVEDRGDVLARVPRPA